AAQSLSSVLRGCQIWYGQDPDSEPAEREGSKQISRSDHFPDLCNGPELFVIMNDIARKQSGDARPQNSGGCGDARRSNARSARLWSVAVGTLALIVLAILAP